MKPSSDLPGAGLPDDVLVSAFRRTGDRDAFEALALRHMDSIRRFLAIGLGRGDDAEEAEQEVLVRLYGSLRSFDSRSSIVTFIYRICRRTAADQVRRKVRDRRKIDRLVLFHADSDARVPEEPHRALAESETRAEILAALGTLPEPDRSILYLRDAEGVSVSELARTFRLPEGTVKSRLSRSREKLRPVLESVAGDGGHGNGR